MCRLVGYIGAPIQLDRLLYKPEHSLIVQSYQPLEMTAGLINADGFGIGWYHTERKDLPYTYRSVLPIWNDINLTSLSRYIESHCLIASVRSATPGLAVNLSNCPPFQHERLLMVHNGYIENFRQTLYRPLRDRLHDDLYGDIQGTTDSEHLFALIRQNQLNDPTALLEESIIRVIHDVFHLADGQVTVGANFIVSTGDRLIASRASNRSPIATLYWLQDDITFPDSVIVASEPLFAGNWQPVPEQSLISINQSLDVEIHPLH